jgi:tetratricopeptide (TPR) repeat protein
MFEEQVNILNIWLKYEPTSKNANAEKKAAFAALGKDESDVDRERWESETSNIQYGLDYIRSLSNADNTEKIIEVCIELLVYEKYNTAILRNLGDAYLNVYKEDDALKIYMDLAKVDPTDFVVAIDISKILINKEEFKDALDWAEKAISMSGKKGEAIYQRGEVLFDIAEFCSVNENEISYWTRAVYELAWQDYRDAFNMGYKEAKNRKIFLEDNNITTIGTWFQLEPRTEIKLSDCPLDCYSWIQRTLKKRNL